MKPIEVITDSDRIARLVTQFSKNTAAGPKRFDPERGWTLSGAGASYFIAGHVYGNDVYIRLPGVMLRYDYVAYCLACREFHKEGVK